MSNQKSQEARQVEQDSKSFMYMDVISYSGEINMAGYEILCEKIDEVEKTHLSKIAVLALATPGGDPHAGFRMARALQHAYDQFFVLVPRYCKSAGTLIAIGAHTLFLDDMSELGPLDIQVKKNDEIVGRNSGLDIIAAVNYLRDQAMDGFQEYCTELVTAAGLSTKAASDIATRLSLGLIEPIAAQIDPMKLAEMHRAMDIAFQYGRRLSEKSCNLKIWGLKKLVTGYPSHEFIIDRKEARTIFERVCEPDGWLKDLSRELNEKMSEHTFAITPVIEFMKYRVPEASDNEDVSNGSRAEKGTSGSSQGDAELHQDEGGAAEGTGLQRSMRGRGGKSLVAKKSASNTGSAS